MVNLAMVRWPALFLSSVLLMAACGSERDTAAAEAGDLLASVMDGLDVDPDSLRIGAVDDARFRLLDQERGCTGFVSERGEQWAITTTGFVRHSAGEPQAVFDAFTMALRKLGFTIDVYEAQDGEYRTVTASDETAAVIGYWQPDALTSLMTIEATAGPCATVSFGPPRPGVRNIQYVETIQP